ncbi:MAG: hypothetical protein R3281_03010, partial [Balneolaceae bacterium]|nr:hypothetical protein [Balneolaceae bacterium]
MNQIFQAAPKSGKSLHLIPGKLRGMDKQGTDWSLRETKIWDFMVNVAGACSLVPTTVGIFFIEKM